MKRLITVAVGLLAVVGLLFGAVYIVYLTHTPARKPQAQQHQETQAQQQETTQTQQPEEMFGPTKIGDPWGRKLWPAGYLDERKYHGELVMTGLFYGGVNDKVPSILVMADEDDPVVSGKLQEIALLAGRDGIIAPAKVQGTYVGRIEYNGKLYFAVRAKEIKEITKIA